MLDVEVVEKTVYCEEHTQENISNLLGFYGGEGDILLVRVDRHDGQGLQSPPSWWDS